MTEPQYLFVSAFSSLYLLHYSCLSILQHGIKASSILAVAFWWLLGLILLAAIFNNSRLGSSPSTISSRLLVHRLQQSHLGSQSTRSSLNHLALYISSWTYIIYKLQLEGECWRYYVWPMRPKTSVGPCTCM
jgi:hypothetical protein